MPGDASGNQRANLVGILVISRFTRETVGNVNRFGINIARNKVLPADAQRPVFAKIRRDPGIHVKTGIIVTIAATVPVAAVVVIDRGGVIIEPGFLQFRRDANGKRHLAQRKLARHGDAVI